MLIIESQDPDLYNSLQERNLSRQYDLLVNLIQLGLRLGPHAADKYTLYALNHSAVSGISQLAGRYRQEPIYIGNSGHRPPTCVEVPELVDRFFSFLYENWDYADAYTLAAYSLWRLNWIHPFIEGNGRTSRAICYYVLCTKLGRLLPGDNIVPDRIRANREPYYHALRAADDAWAGGDLDLSEMSNYIAGLVKAQISNT
ncbi:Fic family protein [Roseovarius sp. LXJ103]|uniref:Fic family protein n=1 Tax=Roseovarius carneus TaxID=2853164 RepID=UPI000D613880|nr:Fic family protein [Roseovarius carneus]MBZ8118345.1 Fic family protein [Roseovarius carneus]PWE35941.1 cell filamentation protein Fic [Pelagicola sp. LXJ1103]